MNINDKKNPMYPEPTKETLKSARYVKLMMGLAMLSVLGGYGYLKYLDHLEYKRQGKWNLLDKYK